MFISTRRLAASLLTITFCLGLVACSSDGANQGAGGSGGSGGVQPVITDLHASLVRSYLNMPPERRDGWLRPHRSLRFRGRTD